MCSNTCKILFKMARIFENTKGTSRWVDRMGNTVIDFTDKVITIGVEHSGKKQQQQDLTRQSLPL